MTAKHKKTEETTGQVKALATFGVSQEDICTFIGVSLPTLHKHYRQELDEASAKGKVAVTKFLFHAASGKAIDEGAAYSDCLRAAMFYAKTRMGWRETQHIDHTSADGSMTPKGLDASKLSDTALQELINARNAEPKQ